MDIYCVERNGSQCYQYLLQSSKPSLLSTVNNNSFYFANIHHSDNNLTLTVLVAAINALWEGMGDVGSARYDLALLPPCPTIRVLSTVTSKFSEIQHFKG